MADQTLKIVLTGDGGALVDVLDESVDGFDDLGDAADKAGKQSRRAGQQLGWVEREARKLTTTNKGLGQSLRLVHNLMVSIGVVVGARQIISYADQYARLEARVERAGAGIADIQAISLRTGTAMDANVALFTRMTIGAKEFGATREDVLAVTEAVQQLGILGGATTEALKFGTTQFSQAMTSGVVRAEEMNSVLENLPELAVRIASGLDMGVASLRKAVIEGNVLSSEVFAALLKQVREINAEFESAPSLVSRSLQNLSTVATGVAGEFEEATGANEKIATSIDDLARALSTATPYLIGFSEALIAVGDAATPLVGLFAAIFGGRLLGKGVQLLAKAGPALMGMAAGVGALNANTLLFVGGAAMMKLEKLSAVGKGGLLGAALFGTYEITKFIIELTGLRDKINELLFPVFEFFDRTERFSQVDRGRIIRTGEPPAPVAKPGPLDDLPEDTQKLVDALIREGAIFGKTSDEILAYDLALTKLPPTTQAAIVEIEKQNRIVREQAEVTKNAKDEKDRKAKAAKKLADAERKAADDLKKSLQFELDQLKRTDRERAVANALRGLSKEQIDLEGDAVAKLAGKLFDEQKALEDSNRAREERRQQMEQLAEEQADAWRRPFENAIDGIQDAGVDMFESIYSGGINGANDFGDELKRLAIRWAAEISALLVFRPVLAGLGTGAVAATSGAVPGSTGQLGFNPLSLLNGGGGGVGLGNIGSLFSTGRNFLTGGLNGIADSALNPFGMAGGFLQDAFGVNALTTGLGQAISLGGPLALLGGALGGSTGAGIGGGFGAGFSVGGPIGGAIGAVLGGLGGSLFGSKPSPPKFHVYGGANPRSPITDNDGWARSVEGFGALGSLQFAGQHLGDNNSILDHQPFIDAVIAMDNQIAGLLGDRALAVAKQAAQSFNVRSKGSISIDSVIRDRQARIGAAIGRAGGNQSLAAALQAPTSLDQLSEDIGLISMLGSSFDGMTQTAGLLAQGMQAVDDKFDALATRARQLSLPLDRLNDLREAEKRQLEQTLGLGGVRDLLNSLTATSASPLDQATQLQNANRLYRDAISAAGAGDQLALNQLPGVANNLLGLLRNQFSHGANFFGGIDFNAPGLALLDRDRGLDVAGFDQIRADLERLLGIPGFADGGITTGLSFAHAGEAVIPLDSNRSVPVTIRADMVAPVVTELQVANDIAAANGDDQALLLRQVSAQLAENNRLLKQLGQQRAVAR